MTVLDYLNSLSSEQTKGKRILTYNCYNKQILYAEHFFDEIKQSKITNNFIKIFVDTCYVR